MKPRPEPCDLTYDDAMIWLGVVQRAGHPCGSVLWTLSLMRDDRDGSLMLEAQQIARFGHAGVMLDGNHWRGWSGGWREFPGTVRR